MLPVPCVTVCDGFGAPACPHQSRRTTTGTFVASASPEPFPYRQLPPGLPRAPPPRSIRTSRTRPIPVASVSKEAPGSALPLIVLFATFTCRRSIGVAFTVCRPYLALWVITLCSMSATSSFAGPFPLPLPTLLDRLIPLLQLRKTELRITNVVLSAAPL